MSRTDGRSWAYLGEPSYGRRLWHPTYHQYYLQSSNALPNSNYIQDSKLCFPRVDFKNTFFYREGVKLVKRSPLEWISILARNKNSRIPARLSRPQSDNPRCRDASQTLAAAWKKILRLSNAVSGSSQLLFYLHQNESKFQNDTYRIGRQSTTRWR